MDLILKTVTPSTSLCVTTALAREQLNLPDGTLDSYVEFLISAATKQIERQAKIAIMPQTWLLETEASPRPIELPRPPLIAIDSVFGKDLIADEWVAVDAAYYTLQTERSPSRLTWVDDQPAFTKVQYQAGYADADSVPDDLKHCVIALMTFLFENRMDVETRMPIALRSMIDSQKCGISPGYFD